jgi:periplasmic protein TonB
VTAPGPAPATVTEPAKPQPPKPTPLPPAPRAKPAPAQQAQPRPAPPPAPPAPRTQPNAVSAARRGEIDAFSKGVVAALAKTKPPSIGYQGNLVTIIRFVLAPTGDLRGIKIVKSSGKPELDRQALLAVRQTRFPVPPPGIAPEDLITDMEYTFD